MYVLYLNTGCMHAPEPRSRMFDCDQTLCDISAVTHRRPVCDSQTQYISDLGMNIFYRASEGEVIHCGTQVT